MFTHDSNLVIPSSIYRSRQIRLPSKWQKIIRSWGPDHNAETTEGWVPSQVGVLYGRWETQSHNFRVLTYTMLPIHNRVSSFCSCSGPSKPFNLASSTSSPDSTESDSPSTGPSKILSRSVLCNAIRDQGSIYMHRMEKTFDYEEFFVIITVFQDLTVLILMK